MKSRSATRPARAAASNRSCQRSRPALDLLRVHVVSCARRARLLEPNVTLAGRRGGVVPQACHTARPRRQPTTGAPHAARRPTVHPRCAYLQVRAQANRAGTSASLDPGSEPARTQPAATTVTKAEETAEAPGRQVDGMTVIVGTPAARCRHRRPRTQHRVARRRRASALGPALRASSPAGAQRWSAIGMPLTTSPRRPSPGCWPSGSASATRAGFLYVTATNLARDRWRREQRDRKLYAAWSW